jgi:hypothetical protein
MKPHQPAIPTLAALSLLTAACNPTPPEQPVTAVYDPASGKLSQLTVNSIKDGKPNVFSYMNGSKIVRIEIDDNEDGKIDRWEYYGPDQKLERVGLSRSDDGKQDSWAYRSADGSVERIEISTKRDATANRTEFYEKGALARAEEDTNGDGRIDKWEEYEAGELVSASFDTTGSGKPTTSVDYRKRSVPPTQP